MIKALTGETLSDTEQAAEKSTSNYNILTSIAEENVILLNGYQSGFFTGFLPKGRVSQNVEMFEKYIFDIRNLKLCLSKVQIFALDADVLDYQLGIKQMSGQSVTPDEERLYKSKCNLVTVRTSKLHEYEASLLQKLDEVATRFYPAKDWDQIKMDLNSPVDVLLNEAHS